MLDGAPSFRVLVVDDYPDAANAMCTLLRLLDQDCVPATRGAEALEVARAFRPQIALVDIGLPDISGYDLCPQLRELSGDDDVFLAAISGWGETSDRVRALAAGFDQHIVKPLDAGTAVRIVRLATAKLGVH